MSAIEAGLDVILITNLNKHEGEIKEKGISVININFRRSSNTPLNDLYNLIKLIILFKKEKPDIVHNVALKTILLGSIAGLFSKNSTIVNSFTGLGYVFSSNQLRARIIQIFIKPLFKLIIKRQSYWTIFQNPDDMELFSCLRLIAPERAVLIRGSGVDLSEFTKTTDKNEIPIVMLASRMLWDKGIAEFVEAAKRAHQNNINAKFLLVGDIDTDNPMSIPISTLNKWAKEDYIKWEGHSANMHHTLSSASIVCLPSYREGLPKILLEAAATGRPLIATNVPGCREIVKDGYNGILVELKDVDSLYKGIVTRVANTEMRKRMGENSRKIVENELSTEIVNSQTLKLYKRMKNTK